MRYAQNQKHEKYTLKHRLIPLEVSRENSLIDWVRGEEYGHMDGVIKVMFYVFESM